MLDTYIIMMHYYIRLEGLVEDLHLAAAVLVTVSAVSLSVHSKVVPPFIAELCPQTVLFCMTLCQCTVNDLICITDVYLG